VRVILFTGKGGVGKTSVAAGTAVQCARAGYRTVVMSTDPAHSLGDSFDVELGSDLVPIAKNLWAHEVSSLHEMQRHWRKLHEYAVEVFSTQGLDEVVAEEVANPPGMDEIASLMWIKHYAQRDEHDVLIVDCAPTGETLQLLTFPDAAKWWLDKIYPWERRAMRVARPVLQPLMGIPLPSDEIFASLKDLLLDLGGMRKVLTDPAITTVRIVLNLEKMVVKEAKRAFSYLSLFGYITDAVIVNRVLPGEVQDELFKKWQQIHRRYQAEVEQSFSGIPILYVPLFDREVV
jgi:arsenite-transporting ATPase